MIFGQIFKPKWQHKDSAVRIEAIETILDLDSPEDRNTLKSLAENDKTSIVRRAALIKLNSFEEWFHAAQTNSDKQTQAYAVKKVENIVFGLDNITLSIQQKFSLLDQPIKLSFVEAWLKIELDENLIITLFEKLEKPHLKVKLFAEKPLPTVQSYLVESTTEIQTLEKMLKKACNEQIEHLILQRIESIREEKNRPKIVAKQAQLLLSKLLALREESEYEVVLKKRTALTQDWSALLSEFEFLSSEKQQQLKLKYEEIDAQLTKVFTAKAEAHEQAKIVAAVQQERKQQFEHLNEALKHCQGRLTDAIFENIALDSNDVLEQLSELHQSVDDSALLQGEKDQLAKQIVQLKDKLQHLDEIAASVTQATHLIAKASQLSPASTLNEFNDKTAQFEQWQQQWRAVVKSAKGYLPQAVNEAHKQISSDWQTSASGFVKEQQKLFHVIKQKFSDINRLINSGKFNAVFGIYKNIQKQYPLLSVKHQQQLKKELDKYGEKINELSDWEHYVATPRKQALVEQVLALVEDPLDNPIEQSNKVKAFRKNWNSLGHAEDDQEEKLNAAFNQACEKAFEPCRLYFAEQEKIRAKNLAYKQTLIAEARAFAGTIDRQTDGKILDAKLSKLKQQWRQSGDVDRKHYLDCKKAFDLAITPVVECVNQYHNDNALAKNELILEAKNALASDDVHQAVNLVKALQKKWSGIGYSGAKVENKLWQNFRQVNDQLFSKRDAIKDQESVKVHAQLAAWQATFDEIMLTASTTGTNVEQTNRLKELIHSLTQLLSEVRPEKRLAASLINNIEKAIKSSKAKLNQLASALTEIHWCNMFQLLEFCLQQGDKLDGEALVNNELLTTLPSNWQKKVLQSFKKLKVAQGDKRQEYTLKLEILAGIESPKSHTEQRMAVQVALMQEQMSSGNTLNTEQLFFQWLALGWLSKEDNELIARIRPIFVNKGA